MRFSIRLSIAFLISLRRLASWICKSCLGAPSLYGLDQKDPAYRVGGSMEAMWGDTFHTRLFWILSISSGVISSALFRMILT